MLVSISPVKRKSIFIAFELFLCQDVGFVKTKTKHLLIKESSWRIEMRDI